MPLYPAISQLVDTMIVPWISVLRGDSNLSNQQSRAINRYDLATITSKAHLAVLAASVMPVTEVPAPSPLSSKDVFHQDESIRQTLKVELMFHVQRDSKNIRMSP